MRSTGALSRRDATPDVGAYFLHICEENRRRERRYVGAAINWHVFDVEGALFEARDSAIASGMDQGMEAGYKQLDAVLAQPA